MINYGSSQLVGFSRSVSFSGLASLFPQSQKMTYAPTFHSFTPSQFSVNYTHNKGKIKHDITCSFTNNINRRAMNILVPALVSFEMFPASAAGVDDKNSLGLKIFPQKKLSDRLTETVISNPGSAAFGTPDQLYYPEWFFGRWLVDSKFVNFQLPLGKKFISDAYLQEVNNPQFGLGSSVTFEARFYSTIANTIENQLKVTLGQVPETKIVADRAFNAISIFNAYLGYDAVEKVEYDPRKDPTRESIIFKTEGPHGEVLAPKRQELFIINRQTENAENGDFFCSESFRRVSIGIRREEVSDSEAIYKFHKVSPTEIIARKRRLIYLQPQDPLYFEAFNKAVAIFDYELNLKRLSNCVVTPKGVEQCASF